MTNRHRAPPERNDRTNPKTVAPGPRRAGQVRGRRPRHRTADNEGSGGVAGNGSLTTSRLEGANYAALTDRR